MGFLLNNVTMGKSKQELQLIKPAHTIRTWTENDLQDIAKCQDPVTGPRYFLENFFHIQHPTKGKVRYTPYRYQRDLLNCYHSSLYAVSLLGRQLGKCLHGSSKINIRNKTTGEVHEISIEDFHNMQSNLQRK